MGAYLLDWVALFFRWFHVIAGIAWIGASFYFVWLDLSLRKPPQWKADKGNSRSACPYGRNDKLPGRSQSCKHALPQKG